MKTLLRSTIRISANDNVELFLRNFHNLRDSNLEFEVAEDKIIWTYVNDFVTAHNHIPEINTIRGHFSMYHESTVLDRLEVVASQPSLTQGDFLTRVEEKAEERRTRQTLEILKTAEAIVGSGIKMKKGKLEQLVRGPIAAVHYVLDRSHDIVTPTLGTKLSGEITSDGFDFLKEYNKVESDPLAGIGQHTGIAQMDIALNGAKRYELWIHTAFTGGLKSTFALNWAYNQAVYYLHSSLFFSLEMPYIQCRRLLYSMHSCHEKFRLIRYWLGLQQNIEDIGGLPYGDIRDGTLHEFNPNAKRFLEEFVVPDFNGQPVNVDVNPDTGEYLTNTKGEVILASIDANGNPYPESKYYGKIHLDVADPEKFDFTVADIRHKAELIYSKAPFSMIFVDHAGLLSARTRTDSTTSNQNEVIRDLKKLSMGFNRGEGMAVVALYQINREGYKQALKRKEKTGVATLDLTALSYANECCKYSELLGISRGIVPIEKVKKGDLVWSSSGWKKVLEVFDQGFRRIWKLTDSRGVVFEATGDHLVRILTEEGIAWSKIKDLKVGSFLIGSCYPFANQVPDIPEWKGLRKMSEKLAWLMGAWDGDGKIRPYGISFTGNRKEVSLEKRLLETLGEIYGHSAKSYHFPSRLGSFDIDGGNKIFKQWFENLAGKRGETVPDIIFQSPSNIVKKYLQGVFDTDGWITNAGSVGMSSKNEIFVRQIQLLLTNLGMDSKLSFQNTYLKKTGKNYLSWIVRVRGYHSRTLFEKLIGFTEPWKMDRLVHFNSIIPQHKKSDAVLPLSNLVKGLIRDYLPYKKSIKEGIRPSVYKEFAKIRRRGLVSEDFSRYLLQVLQDKGIQDSRLDFLELALKELRISQVVSVVDTKQDDRVYDLEVTGDHEYQTGPFLSHNCERSADIITASWIDDDLKKENKVQFQNLKSRDQQPFEVFISRVEWPYRRILTCDNYEMTTNQKEAVGRALDELQNKLNA